MLSTSLEYVNRMSLQGSHKIPAINAPKDKEENCAVGGKRIPQNSSHLTDEKQFSKNNRIIIMLRTLRITQRIYEMRADILFKRLIAGTGHEFSTERYVSQEFLSCVLVRHNLPVSVWGRDLFLDNLAQLSTQLDTWDA